MYNFIVSRTASHVPRHGVLIPLLFTIFISIGLFAFADSANARAYYFSRGEYAGDFVKEKESGRIWYIDPVESRRYQISEKDNLLFERLMSLAQVKSWPQILSAASIDEDKEVPHSGRIGLMGIVHDENNPTLLWHVQKRAYKRVPLTSREDVLEYAKGAMEVDADELYEYPIHYSDFEYVIEDPTGQEFPMEQLAYATSGKHITINLREQRLRAYENKRLTNEFYISSGRWGYWTRKGLHSVLKKAPVVHYAWTYGPDHPENYDLGNVPYNLRIYPHTYIHYAYWHYNFGRPMSHGCVNVNLANMKWIYRWADEGVPVLVY
ncbi:L,D-transpeptidase family protein [Candidatus Uhrbacteria bacterium]|nr:L,D-transpeptidase family protein [Candidatus Uhrbacteria bacterium]